MLSFSIIIANTDTFERRNNLKDFTNTVCIGELSVYLRYMRLRDSFLNVPR